MDNQRVFEPLAIKFVIIRVICGEINKFMSHVFQTKNKLCQNGTYINFFL